jgi:hypothetical protein
METSWQIYVSNLNSRTPIKTWDIIRRITGKGQWQGIKQLETNCYKITNINKIVNTLAKTISNHSGSSNYTKIFGNFGT